MTTPATPSTTVVFTFKTSQLPGTYYWTNDGPDATTEGADFLDGQNSGSFTVTGSFSASVSPPVYNTGTFSRTMNPDLKTEGPEYIHIRIRRDSTSGRILTTMNKILVNDTSTYIVLPTTTTPPPVIISAKLPDGVAGIITENGTNTWTVQTNGITDGTVLTWTIKHTTTDTADFTAESGSFTITGNTGSFTIAPVADLKTEGTETFTIEITGPGSIAPYTTVINQLNDTSIFTTTTTTTTTSTTTTSTTTTSTTPPPTSTTTTTSTTPPPTSTTTTTTTPPAIIPSVTLTGPTCIDTITPGAVSQFTATFSAPVTGFDSSDITALSSEFVGLTITGITNVDGIQYTIDTVVGSLPYDIVNRRTAVLKGSTGLTLLLATDASGTPQNIYPSVNNKYGARDESIIPTTLPFNVAFPTSPTTAITGNTFWVTSNSILYLSGPTQDQGTGYPLSLSAPPVPAIVLGSTDGGVFNIYGGSDDGGVTYRIRWEGVAVFTSPTIDKVWEATFYADDPTKFSIDISSAWVSGGTSYMKNDTTQLYDLTSEVAANKGFDLVISYKARVPAGVAQSSTGDGNTLSNLLKILLC